MDRLQVLVLEDRAADAELMIAELRRGGFSFDWHRVDNERDFAAHLTPPPDLILADFNMPQFTGVRALQIVRGRGLDIPFIIVSGSIGEDVAVRALQEGADDYLLKDRLTRLGAAASQALEAKRLRDKKRQTEDELTRERSLLRTMIDTLPDFISVKDRDSRFLLVNRAYAEFLGQNAPDDLTGKTVRDVYPSDLAAQYIADDQVVLKTKQSMLNQESRTVDRSGNALWHLVNKIPLRNGTGEIAGVVSIARDITAHKHAEEQIAHQLETLTALYSTAQKLAQSLNVDELARDTVERSVREFGARLAWIGRVEPDGAIRLLGQWPPEHPYPATIIGQWGDSPEGQVTSGRSVRSSDAVVIQDVATDPGVVRRETLLELGFKQLAAFPLVSRDNPFGVLVLYSDQADFFTPARIAFLRALSNQAAAALQNARLFEDAERRLRQLHALRQIDMAITGSLDLRVTLDVILDQVTTHLKADAANVFLFDPHTQTLGFAINRGFRSKVLQTATLRLGEGHAGRAALERQIVTVRNLAGEPGKVTYAPQLAAEGFVSYVAVPLLSKGQVKGVLEVLHRTGVSPTPDWLAFLEALAGQAAIAIDNANLFDNLERLNTDLVMAYDATIEGWSRALDLRDRETEGHSQRVTDLTLRLARTMGIPETDLVHIRRGALLHDIGKMGIPDAILLKPGPLSDEEWQVMRRHPTYAYELLAPIGHLRGALDIPYCHHEKWDGTGYPRGLRGEQIPLAARIFAVPDVYDALTSARPYRPAWTTDRALAYIRENAETHFDPRIVEVFSNHD